MTNKGGEPVDDGRERGCLRGALDWASAKLSPVVAHQLLIVRIGKCLPYSSLFSCSGSNVGS